MIVRYKAATQSVIQSDTPDLHERQKCKTSWTELTTTSKNQCQPNVNMNRKWLDCNVCNLVLIWTKFKLWRRMASACLCTLILHWLVGTLAGSVRPKWHLKPTHIRMCLEIMFWGWGLFCFVFTQFVIKKKNERKCETSCWLLLWSDVKWTHIYLFFLPGYLDPPVH